MQNATNLIKFNYIMFLLKDSKCIIYKNNNQLRKYTQIKK